MKKLVFVTGADGFIGSHLVEGLVNQGHQVRCLAQYNSFGTWGWLDTLPGTITNQIEVILGDVRDEHQMLDVSKNCDCIMHLAALVAIPFSYQAPSSYIHTNVMGTLNILNAAKTNQIPHTIITSTSETYGSAQFVPINEQHPICAQSPYAASKAAADQIALSFHRSFDLQVSLLRPFNTYGPKQSARAVIPTIITQIASGNTNIKLGNLAPTRDFTFVKDTVQGFIQMMEKAEGVGEATNIGSNFEISIGELTFLIAEIMGQTVQIEPEKIRERPTKSEVDRLLACTKKAAASINWDPKYAGLDGLKRGLVETISWFTKEENLAKYRGGYNT